MTFGKRRARVLGAIWLLAGLGLLAGAVLLWIDRQRISAWEVPLGLVAIVVGVVLWHQRVTLDRFGLTMGSVGSSTRLLWAGVDSVDVGTTWWRPALVVHRKGGRGAMSVRSTSGLTNRQRARLADVMYELARDHGFAINRDRRASVDLAERVGADDYDDDDIGDDDPDDGVVGDGPAAPAVTDPGATGPLSVVVAATGTNDPVDASRTGDVDDVLDGEVDDPVDDEAEDAAVVNDAVDDPAGPAGPADDVDDDTADVDDDTPTWTTTRPTWSTWPTRGLVPTRPTRSSPLERGDEERGRLTRQRHRESSRPGQRGVHRAIGHVGVEVP